MPSLPPLAVATGALRTCAAAGCSAVLLAAALSLPWGCRGVEPLPDPAREVTASAFSDPSEVSNPQPPSVAEAGALGTGGTSVGDGAETNGSGAGGSTEDPVTVASGDAGEIRVGRVWVVDALIGQINGRPLYAGEFLDSLEDRILRLRAEDSGDRARLATADLVSQRLQQYVNNELVIAEAEQQLSPEMKVGLMSFLQQIRETTIAGYGGTRQGAEASLAEQYGMSLDEFVNERKNEALARELLRKRIQPRVVVAWRDVELAFSKVESQASTKGTVVVGRIRLPIDDARVADVRERLGAGASFNDLATELGIEGGGKWQEFDYPAGGLAGLELAEDIRSAITAVPQGTASAPIERASSIQWYCVVDITEPNKASIWDPVIQLTLRGELEAMRRRREQDKYLLSLRDRWISSDFDDMRRRLVAIAIQRYFPE